MLFRRGVVLVPGEMLGLVHAMCPQEEEVAKEPEVSSELSDRFVQHLIYSTKTGKLKWESLSDRVYRARVGVGEVFLWEFEEGAVHATVKLPDGDDYVIPDAHWLKSLWELVVPVRESPIEKYMRTILEEGNNATDGIKQ